MPVSGLVITLGQSTETHARTIAQLANDPCITLGPCAQGRVAVTLETDRDHRDAVRSLQDLPGVALVDVVFLQTTGPNERASRS